VSTFGTAKTDKKRAGPRRRPDRKLRVLGGVGRKELSIIRETGDAWGKFGARNSGNEEGVRGNVGDRLGKN